MQPARELLRPALDVVVRGAFQERIVVVDRQHELEAAVLAGERSTARIGQIVDVGLAEGEDRQTELDPGLAELRIRPEILDDVLELENAPGFVEDAGGERGDLAEIGDMGTLHVDLAAAVVGLIISTEELEQGLATGACVLDVLERAGDGLLNMIVRLAIEERVVRKVGKLDLAEA